MLHCSEPFIITHSSSQYDLNNVEKAIKYQIIIKLNFVFRESIPENTEAGTIIKELKVANQEGDVDCTIDLEGNKQGSQGGTIFTIVRDRYKKNCLLKLSENVQLDYEKEQRYRLHVHVRHQRVKRQGLYNNITIFTISIQTSELITILVLKFEQVQITT